MLKTIHLPTLNISFEAPDNILFRDDGIVDDKGFHTKEVYKEYGAHLSWYQNIRWNKIISKIISSSGGTHLNIPLINDREINIIYYMKPKLSPEINFPFIRGHEETHALHYMGHINLLLEKLPCKYDVNSNPRKCTLHEKELIADLGGLYALQLTGYNINDIDINNNPMIREALVIYTSKS